MANDSNSNPFWRSPLGRSLMFGGVALAIAFGIKVYFDGQKMNKEAERKTTKGELEALHADLLETLKSSNTKPATLPTSAPWYPESVECGEFQFVRGDIPATWRPILKKKTIQAPKSRYQIKFLRQGTTAYWIARRDGDCDGFFEVHTLRGSLDWTASFQKTYVETQNLGE